MNGLGQDLRYGVRGLARQRGFTLVALLALGLTIGLNTSLFTVYNIVAFRPWPVPEPERVVRIHRLADGRARGLSVAQYRYLAEHTRAFKGLALMSWYESDHVNGGRILAQYVSGNYFRVLGVPMQKGRAFLESEDERRAPQAVAILTDDAWRRHFDGDPNIIGRTVVLREASLTVVGVAAPGFYSTEIPPREMFVPVSARRLVRPEEASGARVLDDPTVCCSDVSGRLADGVSAQQGRAELEQLSHQFFSSRGEEGTPIAVAGTAILEQRGMRWLGSGLHLMFAATALVLLLACANVGNLLLARAAARRHEIAVRRALGASRARVIRQLLTEGLVLAAGAAALGIGLAFVLPRATVAAMFTLTPSALDALGIRPDLAVLVFTVIVATMTCLASALAPAIHATRESVGTPLKSRSANATPWPALRGALLATQVAVSVVLLTGSGLLARGVSRARVLDLGFQTSDVTLVTFHLPARYEGPQARPLIEQLRSRLSALPGAPRFGFTNQPPLNDMRVATTFRVPGQPDTGVSYYEVSPGYFEVLGLPIVRGRNFAADDRSAEVLVVNETLARRFWPDGNAVGQSVTLDKDHPQTAHVIGVVKDSQYSNLGPVQPKFYRPTGYPRHDAYDENVPYVLIADPGGHAAAAMAGIAAGLDPTGTAEVAPLARRVDLWLRPSSISAALAIALGLLALVLAMIGMAGVFAYAVHQRTREIGIRISLGAETRHVLRLVLGSSARAIGVGLALGAAGAIAASRLLESRLFGLSPLDPLALSAVAVVLGLAGLVATYIPARRALRIEPTVALRYE